MPQPARNTRPNGRFWLLLASASALLMAVLALALVAFALYVLRHDDSRTPRTETPASSTSDDAGAGCKVRRSGPLAFRSEGAQDTLHVSIEGTPCTQARLSIIVQAPDGAVLYRYDAPFPSHLTAEEARKPLPQAAEAFAASVFANAGIAGTTDALPPWADATAYYAEHQDAMKIDRAAYEALRRVKRPIFWHATGAETWRSVVYDPQTQKGRVILAGGA